MSAVVASGFCMHHTWEMVLKQSPQVGNFRLGVFIMVDAAVILAVLGTESRNFFFFFSVSVSC